MQGIGHERAWHLEGVRGLACASVCLLHGFGMFLPSLLDGTGRLSMAIRWSPLRLLYDGDSAVFLFFALSGYVLTSPFRRQANRPRAAMAARVVRFLLPALLACLLGFAVCAALGETRLAAARIVGVGWLNGSAGGPISFAGWFADAIGNALMLGYRGLSALDPVLGDALWPNDHAFNPPLWTLSLELQGSALVLLLAMARRRGFAPWIAAVCVAAMLSLRAPMLCFVVGHLAAMARGKRIRGERILAVIALSCGLGLCYAACENLVPWDGRGLAGLPALSPALMQHGWGAMLIFLAVHRAGVVCPSLDAPWLRWLGGMSFPLYLVHWPVLVGFGGTVTVLAGPWAGLLAGLAGSVAAAVPFRWMDRKVLESVRRLRAAMGDRREGPAAALNPPSRQPAGAYLP